jgi:uncharacterized protein YciI
MNSALLQQQKHKEVIMYLLLLYDVVDDYVNRRAPFRDDHLRVATEAVEKGQLILGGAFDNPVDGAALVFKADDRSVVEEFVNNDPYVQNGLITSWKIREWTVVIGSAL